MQRYKEFWDRLLHKSSRLLKIDTHYIASGSFWFSMGQIVAVGVGFILSLGFANLLPKEVYGNYKFVLSIAALIGAFSLTGLGDAVTRASAQGHEGVLKKGFDTGLKWSIPMIIIGLGVSVYYLVQGDSELSISIFIAVLFSALLACSNLYGPYLRGKKLFRTETTYGFAISIIPPLILLATIFLTHRVLYIILIYFITITSTSLFLYFKTRRRFTSFATPTDLSDTISFAKHLSVMSVIGRAAAYIDKILVFYYLGTAQLAIYTFSIMPIQNLGRLNAIISNLALPKLSTRPLSEIKKTIIRKMFLLFCIAVIVVASYILLAPVFFKILLPQYLDSVPYSQVFALSFLSLPGVLFGQTLLAHARKKELYFINTVSPIIKITALFVLLPLFGIWGAIGALLITNIVGFLIGFAVFISIKMEKAPVQIQAQ